MSSIYAQFGTIGQSIQLPSYPRIIVVGTHADQLAPGQPIQARKEVIAQVILARSLLPLKGMNMQT